MVQARAAGLVSDRWEMRRLINSFLSPKTFLPTGSEEWEAAYQKYQSINIKK
jgi:rhamnulokinase